MRHWEKEPPTHRAIATLARAFSITSRGSNGAARVAPPRATPKRASRDDIRALVAMFSGAGRPS